MVIGKLEAAKLYTFAVRNVSKELGIASAPMGIRQITRKLARFYVIKAC
jgi:hypothetical protein